MNWKTATVGIALAGTTATGGVFAADQAVNPYEDRGTHYELPIVSDIPQGERVEMAKDRAEVTLKGWNDEYAIKITPQIPTAQLGAADRPFVTEATRPLLSKRMEWKEGDVTAFIEPKSENEFDIDFTLDSKPDTNVFTYKIEGADQFDFFYQPELTAEEIADGAERPENVAGSYAVYHKTKANHRIGDTNYATGKAFHIYRPKAIDANGAETWAKLRYGDGVLTVTVPEQWMEAAVYPVQVDPTIGNTSLGGTNLPLANNAYLGVLVTDWGSTGTVDSFSIGASEASGTSQVKAILTDAAEDNIISNGIAGAANITGAAAFRVSTFATPPAVSNGTGYALYAIFSENSDLGVRYDTGTFSGRFAAAGNFASPIAPTFEGAGHGPYSIFATYTAAGGGAAPDSGTTVFFE